MNKKFEVDILSASNFTSFGFCMSGRKHSTLRYRYGFNGKEKDDEINSEGNSYDFGARIYDDRLGRFLSIDSKTGEAASWNPYHFAVDNPIMYVDINGEWPGVTFMFYEGDVGGGLTYGLNYVEQGGMAWDEVGKTHFTMKSSIIIYSEGESTLGAGAGITLNGKQNWSAETFYGAVLTSSVSLPMVGGDFGVGVAVNLGFNSNEFTIGGGVGIGLKMSVVNCTIAESISLTDAQAEIVNDATAIITEEWNVHNKTSILDANGVVVGYSATVATKSIDGKVVDTGIKIYSEGTSNSWMSSEYKSQSIAEEKEDDEDDDWF